jgi:hypothetical protein
MLYFSRWRGARWWTILTLVASGLTLLGNSIYFSGGETPRVRRQLRFRFSDN